MVDAWNCREVSATFTGASGMGSSMCLTLKLIWREMYPSPDEQPYAWGIGMQLNNIRCALAYTANCVTTILGSSSFGFPCQPAKVWAKPCYSYRRRHCGVVLRVRWYVGIVGSRNKDDHAQLRGSSNLHYPPQAPCPHRKPGDVPWTSPDNHTSWSNDTHING